MASLPADLITYLDPLVMDSAGTDLFEGPPPELPADVVVLTHYAGEPALGRVMGESLTEPGVEVALVQLFVRHSVMATAKTKADSYHALLDNFNGTIGSRIYFQIESASGMPYSIGQDERGLWRMVCNYRVQYERS